MKTTIEIQIPEYYWPNGKAIIGAFEKDWIAASEGKQNKPPYEDKRGGYHNNITFSRAFIQAWDDGWKHYHSSKEALP